MAFWSRERRKKDRGEPEGTPEPAALPGPQRLSVVEFWTGDQRHVVGIDLSRERLADLLNREASVRVAMLDFVPDDRTLQVEVDPGMRWSNLAVEESLLVFPPPQPTNPSRRLHRPRQPVEILIGPFEVAGFAHIPPGGQAAGFLMRSGNRFGAVTRAVVRDPQLAGFEQRADVLLVNLQKAGTIRDVDLREQPGTGTDAGDAPPLPV